MRVYFGEGEAANESAGTCSSRSAESRTRWMGSGAGGTKSGCSGVGTRRRGGGGSGARRCFLGRNERVAEDLDRDGLRGLQCSSRGRGSLEASVDPFPDSAQPGRSDGGVECREHVLALDVEVVGKRDLQAASQPGVKWQ